MYMVFTVLAAIFVEFIRTVIIYQIGVLLEGYKAFLTSQKAHFAFLEHYAPEESDSKDHIEMIGGLVRLYAIAMFVTRIIAMVTMGMGNDIKLNL